MHLHVTQAISPERLAQLMVEAFVLSISVVTIEDGTNGIYPAFLVDEEGTVSSFRGLTRSGRAAWSVLLALTAIGQPLLPHAGGGRQGFQDDPDAGRQGAE